MNKLLSISYDGSKYKGYATQPHHNTVQDTLEKTLKKLTGHDIKTIAASRTDSGVHALDQKVLISIAMDNDNLKRALNSLLPSSIVINSIEEVDNDFHPRYNVKSKTYKYIISTKLSPFNGPYKTYYPYELDINKMQLASKILLGTHDFSSFCASKSGVNNKIRTIFNISIEQTNDDIIFTFKGDGFLYNMIRIIVGTLIDIGIGKTNLEMIEKILTSKNRKLAGKTFPPNGLYLVEIQY